MGVILRIPLDHMENVGLTRTHTRIVNVQLKSKWRKIWIGWKMTLSLSLWNGVLRASSLEHANRQLRVSHVRLIPWLHVNISSRYISFLILLLIIWFVAHLPMRKRFGAISTIIIFTRCAAVWMPFILDLVFLVYPISSCEFQLIFSVCLPPPSSKENRGKLFLLGQI